MVSPLINGTEGEAISLWKFYESQFLPEEKAKIDAEKITIAKELREQGSVKVPGLGQRVCKFPLVLVVRLTQMYPGWREDKGFVDSILADNPEFCAPGYKPKPNIYRKGLTGGWGIK